MIDNELQARMRYAIGKLPEPMRETVILWSETDMTIPEIAHSLGCSPRTVTLRMERVRAMLRRKLTLLTDGDGSSSIRARVAHRPPGSVRNKTAPCLRKFRGACDVVDARCGWEFCSPFPDSSFASTALPCRTLLIPPHGRNLRRSRESPCRNRCRSRVHLRRGLADVRSE